MADVARPSSDDVCQEAARQRVVEGWTVEHDLQHANGELVLAALTYITGDESWWPWDNRPKFRPRDLIKAGGLLLAEDKRREVAERRDECKGNAVPFQSPAGIESLLRWLHAEAAFERDQLAGSVDALRHSHHIPHVDEDHQGGNCADIVIDLIARATRAERDPLSAEASRRDWAVEAMRLDVELDFALRGRRRLTAEIRDALDLIEKLTDMTPCDHFDHHGACQTHGSDPGQCHHQAARRFLASNSRPVCAVHPEEAESCGDQFEGRVCRLVPCHPTLHSDFAAEWSGTPWAEGGEPA